MVRLKDTANNKLAGTYVISIPYGAIKSISKANDYSGDKSISIPYGAIKRW